MSIRVVLADGHRIVLEGLAALFGRETDIEVVGQAEEGLRLVKLAREVRPGVVVTDICMPGLSGIEAIHRILAENIGIKVLVLSAHAESCLVRAALESGASGYLLKRCAFDELARAVRGAGTNRIYLSPEIVGTVVGDYRSHDAAVAPTLSAQLTAREREVVQLFAEGYSTYEIAERLHLSSKTVATHREHIMQKLQLHGIADLTRYAIREGLCSLDAPCRSTPRPEGERIKR